MAHKIAFIMDPPERINPFKDSTFAMILAAQKKGFTPYVLGKGDLYLREDGQACARAIAMEAHDREKDFLLPAAKAENLALTDFHQIYMRCDPPVDSGYMAASYILDHAFRQGAFVANAPQALQRYNEKLYATLFPDLIPPTLVSSDKELIRDFVERHKKAIIKPLDLMGGQGVYLASDPDVNLDVICELETRRGQKAIIAQKFLPAIEEGDRRVIIIGDQILEHVLVRLPAKGSIRGNLAAGGGHEIQPLNNRDREIAETLRLQLKKDGVIFAGLDIIGGKLIEINHTSPTGLREIEKVTGSNPAEILFSPPS